MLSSPMTTVYSCSSMHPMQVVHGASLASWSLDPAFLSTLHHLRSIVDSLIDLLHRLSTTTLQQHLYIHISQAKRHIAQYTQHNTLTKIKHSDTTQHDTSYVNYELNPKSLKPLSPCINHSSQDGTKSFLNFSQYARVSTTIAEQKLAFQAEQMPPEMPTAGRRL